MPGAFGQAADTRKDSSTRSLRKCAHRAQGSVASSDMKRGRGERLFSSTRARGMSAVAQHDLATTALGKPVERTERPVGADQRPICFSNPAVQREEAGTAGIRQISTLTRHSRTATFEQALARYLRTITRASVQPAVEKLRDVDERLFPILSEAAGAGTARQYPKRVIVASLTGVHFGMCAKRIVANTRKVHGVILAKFTRVPYLVILQVLRDS
jgi:hypothetical protein